MNYVVGNTKSEPLTTTTIELITTMKKKLYSLQKEKTDLICRNIKLLIAILSKLMSEIENTNIFSLTQSNQITDLLNRIKLLLKLTRLINEKAKEESQCAESQSEQTLFEM